MKILFVCTGNTARSPMAEGIFRKIVAENNAQEKFMCQSAGMSASKGDWAKDYAINSLLEIGIDISEHRARKLKPAEIPMWDVFFAMSKTHAYILNQSGVPMEKIYVSAYISDPYGGDLNKYRKCRDVLYKEISKFYKKIEGYSNDNN